MPADIKAGDVIGFSGRHFYSVLINIGTFGVPLWGLSHVGIMADAPDGRLLLFESTDDSGIPCEISRRPVVGVQAHTLESVVEAYRGRMWHYPLYRPLYVHERCRLAKFLESTAGRPYDTKGALRAAGFLFALAESAFRGQDLAELFCSETCCAAHAVIGLFPTGNASEWSPNRFVRTERGLGILGRPKRIRKAA